MDIWIITADIVVLLAVALLLGIVAERLKQNALIGYLFTGVLLGPSVLGWVQGVDEVRGLAELGVALLLFTIGLEFSLRRLRELGAVATLGGTAQIVLTGAAVSLICVWLGLPFAEAVVVGAALSVSSTAVALRVLLDRAELESLHGRNALGILLLQDLAVVPLVLLVSVLGEGSDGWTAVSEIGLRIGMASALAVVIFLGLKHLSPRLLLAASSLQNRDLPVVLAITVCLGSTWASHALGLSPVLGAFVAGMVLAESPFASQIRADVGPLRAWFVTVFFASIGLIVQLPLGRDLAIVAALATCILALKAVLVGLVMRLFRQPHRVALATGLVLAQIGEFSFVLLDLGHGAALVSKTTFQWLLSASIVTLLLTPYLIASGSRLSVTLVRRSAAERAAPRPVSGEAEPSARPQGRVIVIGFGPAGQKVVSKLRASQMPFLVLEVNARTVAVNRSIIPIEMGDATQADILAHIKLSLARAVVVTVPDPLTAQLIVRQIKTMNPEMPVIARARYHAHANRLREAGADYVIDEEDLVGDRIGVEVLRVGSTRFAEPGDAGDRG